MDSLWLNSFERPQFSHTLPSKTHVLIVGGGITGILCAYMLQQTGVDYILVEADEICSGITKNTTAKITILHGLLYDKLIRSHGYEGAESYLQANQMALHQYHKFCQSVDCDYEQLDAVTYSLNDREKIEYELEALHKLGFSADFADHLPLPFQAAGAVRVKHQAQFHPLKFLFALAKDLRICEHTKVLEFIPDGVVTNHGTIRADKTIITTHFPMLNKHGSYFLKLYQHRSYVLALKNAPNVDGMYIDENKKGLSFRNYGDLLLLGGGAHRTGKKGGNWQELADFARQHYPQAQEVSRWATQDCMSLDGIPYIGQYSSRTPNLYVATGYNKWGMTSAMAAATILTDQILGRDNPHAWVFSPSRTILRPQLFVNIFESTVGLLTPTVPRCPHLGCALKYNPQEHSWDCPCHGSRFTREGKLIDNPATDDKTR
ncbi:MAG: FAD-dependent oxidoreductase [Firmicutes bacterium]|nr:FAD-dependent oxidoreductase [Bacillota bacterium]